MSNVASKLNHTKDRSKRRFLSCDRILQKSFLALFAAILLVPASGCASGIRIPRLGFGDALLEKYRDNVWAKRAFNLRYANCDIPYTEHFQNGFVAGYSQKSNGGDGYVPPLPPDEYRGYEFQSADGAQCVKAWFDGFPAGVAAAKKDRAGDFHDIYTSKMVNSAIVQESAEHVLPDDVPVLKGSVAKAEMRAASQAPPLPSSTYRAAKPSPYVAPPTTTPNPILNPNSITASDLTPAPKINKTGPAAMKPASSRFTIDPAVAVTGPIVPTVSAMADASDAATLPPIVTKTTSRRNFEGKVNSAVANVARRASTVGSQTPLPMSVGKPSWESKVPAIRR